MNIYKGRISKIFANLNKTDSDLTKTDISEETYTVNLNGSLSLESVMPYNTKNTQAITSTVIEGKPKDIFITGHKTMLLNHLETIENTQTEKTDFIQTFDDDDTTRDFTLVEENSEEMLDRLSFQQVTVNAEIHQNPVNLTFYSKPTSFFEINQNLDNIESSKTEVKSDLLNKHAEKINIEEHEISSESQSILISSSNYPHDKANDCNSVQEITDDSNDGLAKDLQKRNRNKKAIKETWKKNKNMKLREEGKEYESRKKDGEVWRYNITKNKKEIKPRCDCKLSSKPTKLGCSKFNEEDRQEIFNYFWQLSWKEKKIYVKTLVVIKATARKRGEQEISKRNHSLELYLEKNTVKIRVCKKMFLNTLSVGEWALKNWARKKNEVENKAIVQEKVNKKVTKKDEVKHFLDLLPKLESHYCRKNSSKMYLETLWESKMQLMRFYNDEFCKEKSYHPVSVATFNEVFDEMNLSLFQPKKDACDLCEKYKTKNVSEEEYRLHIQKKESARREKENDKNSEKEVFTMDLQAVQLCPKSNVSSLYFKTKLAVHNFTGYDIKRKEGYCFIWNEAEGGVTSNEFASVIIRMLELFIQKNNIQEGTEIVLFSDGCTYQNRNVTLSNALLHFAMSHGVTIVQKILEKGHTQMEADSMHSVIERQIRKKKINVPADYVQIAKSSCRKKPYYVEYLQHDFFKNFESVLNYKSIRPGTRTGDPVVTDIRQLRYSTEGKIYYRLGFTDDTPELPLPRRIHKFQPRSIDDLPPLYTQRLKIKKSKFLHLQELKLTMESDFHAFFDALPYED